MITAAGLGKYKSNVSRWEHRVPRFMANRGLVASCTPEYGWSVHICRCKSALNEIKINTRTCCCKCVGMPLGVKTVSSGDGMRTQVTRAAWIISQTWADMTGHWPNNTIMTLHLTPDTSKKVKKSLSARKKERETLNSQVFMFTFCKRIHKRIHRCAPLHTQIHRTTHKQMYINK